MHFEVADGLHLADHESLKPEGLLLLGGSVIAEFFLQQEVDRVGNGVLLLIGLRVNADVDWPAGARAPVMSFNHEIVCVAGVSQLRKELLEQNVRRRFAEGVALADGVELFVEHALERLASQVEQDAPRFGLPDLVNVHEVQLVDVRVQQQVLGLLVEVPDLFVFERKVLFVFLVN